MLVRSSNGSYEFIDFRETAPAAAFQDMYKNNTNASISGGLARYDLPCFQIGWEGAESSSGIVVCRANCAVSSTSSRTTALSTGRQSSNPRLTPPVAAFPSLKIWYTRCFPPPPADPTFLPTTPLGPLILRQMGQDWDWATRSREKDMPTRWKRLRKRAQTLSTRGRSPMRPSTRSERPMAR